MNLRTLTGAAVASLVVLSATPVPSVSAQTLPVITYRDCTFSANLMVTSQPLSDRYDIVYGIEVTCVQSAADFTMTAALLGGPLTSTSALLQLASGTTTEGGTTASLSRVWHAPCSAGDALRLYVDPSVTATFGDGTVVGLRWSGPTGAVACDGGA